MQEIERARPLGDAEFGEALPSLRPGTPGRPPHDRYREQYGVIVVCPDEVSQRSLFEGLRALLAGCRLKVVVT